MRKGVILEVGENDVTLITPNGEFLRAQKLQQEYEIGEEILFRPLETEGNRKRNPFAFFQTLKGRAVILAVAAVFLIVTVYPLFGDQEVYAYMSIDVNPSIELGLNEELNVISIKAYNNEGKQILKNIDEWKNHSAVDVADKIIDEIENQGYLTEDKNVLISTVPSKETNDDKNDVLGKTITEIKKVTAEEEIAVTVINGTIEERNTAVKQGITTGKYKEELQVTIPNGQEKDKGNNKGENVQPNSQKTGIPVNKEGVGAKQNSKKEQKREEMKMDKLDKNKAGKSNKDTSPGQSKKFDDRYNQIRQKINQQKINENLKRQVENKEYEKQLEKLKKQADNKSHEKRIENFKKQADNKRNEKQAEPSGKQIGNKKEEKRTGPPGKQVEKKRNNEKRTALPGKQIENKKEEKQAGPPKKQVENKQIEKQLEPPGKQWENNGNEKRNDNRGPTKQSEWNNRDKRISNDKENPNLKWKD